MIPFDPDEEWLRLESRIEDSFWNELMDFDIALGLLEA